MSNSLRPPLAPSRVPSRSSSQNSTNPRLPLLAPPAPSVQAQIAGGGAQITRMRSPVHLPLYRRLLFPHDTDPERRVQLVVGEGAELDLLNERLHHFVALVLRAYVLSWYTRFTRDRTLLPLLHNDLLVPVLSPVLTRAHQHPENVCGLVLLDVPALAGMHWRTYWEAKEGVALMSGRAGVAGDATALAEGYHARLPLLCVAPAEPPSTQSFVLSPLYLSALATALLPSPPSPMTGQPDVQRLMAREVLARAVLAGACRRLYHGWFWYGLMLRFLGEPGDPIPWRPSSKREVAGKTSTPDADGDDGDGTSTSRTIDQVVLHTLARLFSALLTLYSTLISFFTFYTSIPVDPSPEYTAKFRGCTVPAMQMLRDVLDVDGRGRGGRRTWQARIVWGGAEMVVGLTGGLLDRLIPHVIISHLNPATSLRLVALTERLLFPLEGGYPGPPPVDPTPEEAADLRTRAEQRLGEVIPGPLRSIFCPEQQDVVRILEPLSDPGCNAHLVGMVLDCLVATLVPDLVADGYGELSGEVGGESRLTSGIEDGSAE